MKDSKGVFSLRSPLAGYPGGKYSLAARIISLIPPHKCYVEVFCGAAWVYFKKPPSACEVLNDINDELINFWRHLQSARGLAYLKLRLAWALHSRRIFEDYRDLEPGEFAALSEAERAWRFLYLFKTSYGGRNAAYVSRGTNAKKPSFAFWKNRPHGLYFLQPAWANALCQCHKRMAGTQIESLSWESCLTRYDTPETFFYLDPPYYGFEKMYGEGIFDQADFARLAAKLAALSGRFILSINDTEKTRQLFAGFHVQPVTVSYSLNKDRPKLTQELLVANFNLGAMDDPA